MISLDRCRRVRELLLGYFERVFHDATSTAKLVFLTIHSNEEFVNACLAEGALGYVVKSPMKSDLIPAIHAALSGQSFVSSGRQPTGQGFP
jgi:DNA-binding NarL/FixJ family response regulator